MGFFFSESSKKVDNKDFEKILHEAGLNAEQREHVKSQLEGKEANEKNIADLVKGLKDDTEDGVNPQAAEKIHNNFKDRIAPPEHNEPPTMDKPRF